MATATKNPAELSPRVRGMILPPDLDLPPGVAEANNYAIAAAIEMIEAEREQAEAARAVKGATQADLVAQREAAAKGKTHEPDKPKKVERLEAARPRARVANARMEEAARGIRDAIRADATYAIDREEDQAAARSQLLGAMQLIPELYAGYLQACALADPAKRISEGASGSVVDTYPSTEKLTAKLSKAIERAKTRRDLPSFEDALAALIIQANGKGSQ